MWTRARCSKKALFSQRAAFQRLAGCSSAQGTYVPALVWPGGSRSRPPFSVAFPAAPALLLPLSLPSDSFSFCFKREKCQFERPAWQTPLRNWYGPDKVAFIYFFCCQASQVPLSTSPTPPSFQYFPVSILPDADSVTRNVCSEALAWWQAADKKM